MCKYPQMIKQNFGDDLIPFAEMARVRNGRIARGAPAPLLWHQICLQYFTVL
jgi:hypothetical protein